MITEGEPPLVGDLSATVSVTGPRSPWVSASSGATVSGDRAELHRADVRPTGDLVVELAPSIVRKGAARAYIAPGGKGEDPYVLFRTEVPDIADSGIMLALVVDTSMSMGVASLETERAIVDAVLEGLGPSDSLLVLAADQTARALGPGHPPPSSRNSERRCAAIWRLSTRGGRRTWQPHSSKLPICSTRLRPDEKARAWSFT